jgi:hypothetical protein
LIVEAEHFFLVSTALGRGEVGLCSFQKSLGASGLGARIGVVENDQKLTLLDRSAFFDKNALHAGGDRSVRFKVVYGLDFPIGRDDTSDLTLMDLGRANLYRIIVADNKGSEQSDGCQDDKRRSPPPLRRVLRTVSIQWHAGKSASFNVSFMRSAKALKSNI